MDREECVMVVGGQGHVMKKVCLAASEGQRSHISTRADMDKWIGCLAKPERGICVG